MQFDSKFFVWLAGVIFVAGGMVYTLHSVADDVSSLSDAVLEHTISDGHPTRGVRVDYLEQRQKETADTVEQIEAQQQTILKNQIAICSKLGADCR